MEHESVIDSTQQRALRDHILAKRGPEARADAQALGPSSGPVLLSLAKHQDRAVRLMVLELAAVAPSSESSRAVIGLLDDDVATVRAVAMGVLVICSQRDIVPDLLRSLRKGQNSETTAALIRQVGIAGDSTNIGDIAPFRSDRDAGVSHQTAIAMARLGDPTERNRVITELSSTDAQVKVEALRDSQYIGDKALAGFFDSALNDLRDFMVITPPHVEPVVVARVCDVAVQTMAFLGFSFSFQAQFLARRTQPELDEAKRMANLVH